MPRQHSLDALRAVAMLLGIGLHATMSFVGTDSTGGLLGFQTLEFFNGFVHGFRMQLFFLLSGFFTAMVWQKRGIRKMIGQRFKRIFLPLVVFTFVMIGIYNFLDTLGPEKSFEQFQPENIWEAAWIGDINSMEHFIEEEGQDINIQQEDGYTLLHVAVFRGHEGAAAWMLHNGLDPNLESFEGYTALDVANGLGDEGFAALLEDWDADEGSNPTPLEIEREDASGIQFTEEYLLGGLFGHLWFLWFLWWMVLLFAVIFAIVRLLKLKKPGSRWALGKRRYLWLLPLTMFFQVFMGFPSFGPDTAAGLWIPPHLFLYYCIFFGFGALYYHYYEEFGPDTRRWYLTLPFATFILFPIGAGLTYEGEGWTLLTVFLQSLYPWMMIFASIGLFRAFFNKKSEFWRYVSDSSYFLYLFHIPLILVIGPGFAGLPFPTVINFLLLSALVTLILLVIYHLFVRYSPIGTFLNGPRYRRQEKIGG